MKFYIYPEGTDSYVAISESGDRVVEFQAKNTDASWLTAQTAALHVRDLVKLKYPGDRHQMLWVPDPDEHPEVRRLLAERRRAERELEDTAHQVTDHACLSCVHSAVCPGPCKAEKIGFKIFDCTNYIHIPTEEDDR